MQPLTVIAVPAFKDNYLWLLVRGSDAVVVDPGDAAPVEDVLARQGLTLRAILLTHHHRDHVGGVADLLASREGLPVFGPARESIVGVNRTVSDGDAVVIDRPALRFEVIDVPGHTKGHVAYFAAAHDDQPPMLFCGDTLFSAGCGRLFEGTPEQMHASLTRLAALPSHTQVYCAHEYTESNLRFAAAVEPASEALRSRIREVAAHRARNAPSLPSTIAIERATNPFLRSDDAAVRAAAERHTAGSGATSLATFTTLRSWKDTF